MFVGSGRRSGSGPKEFVVSTPNGAWPKSILCVGSLEIHNREHRGKQSRGVQRLWKQVPAGRKDQLSLSGDLHSVHWDTYTI